MAELLFSSLNRVEIPFVKVTFGDPEGVHYTFGIKNTKDQFGIPNFVKSLQVKKINGTVNTYTLQMDYPITDSTDPNFMEKVFSSISQSRKIIFSYGDLATPTFIFKEEQAVVTKIATSFSGSSSVISYTITATSSGYLAQGGSYTFKNRYAQPSSVIIELLKQNYGGITDIFTGMTRINNLLIKGIIPQDDQKVHIEAQTNVSILEYIKYLVSCMIPNTAINAQSKQNAFYTINIIDDTTGDFGGPYFKISKVSKAETNNFKTETYEIDIGYPSQNIVTDFSTSDNQGVSMLYEYDEKINPNEYVERINDDGTIDSIYSPSNIKNTSYYTSTANSKIWYTKMTQFPITASITLKGLLRPAILMTHVKINVLYFGRKHISSGLYLITSQTDTVDSNGYKTTLELQKISGDDEYE